MQAEVFRWIALQGNGSERPLPQVERRIASREAELEEMPPASGALQHVEDQVRQRGLGPGRGCRGFVGRPLDGTAGGRVL